MVKIATAARRNERLDTLYALREKIAKTLDKSESGRDIAALSKRLVEVMDEIELLEKAMDEESPLARAREKMAQAGKQVRYGSQSPTFHTVGDYEYSLSNIAMELFDAWGIGFYPSQEYELELFLARDANDGTACRTICISKPRQNGKSYAARFYAIWCACVEGKQVLYTAHHGDTVNEMFEILENLCGDIKDLRANLRSTYRGKGHQCIKFTNGGRIDFRTRTAAGGRGRTYDVVIYDEAQELNDAQLSAIKATIIASESGDPQSIYLGTPPDPECTGTVFRGFHKQVHAGDSEGIWWLEWSVDEIPDMSDVDTVMELAYETNPALGYRIKEDVMRDTIITSKNDPDSFAREVLGFWSKEVIVKGVLNKHDWGACSTTDPPKTG